MYPIHQSTVSRLYVPSSTIHSQLSVYIQFNSPQSAVCIYLVRQSIVSHLYVPSSSIHSQPSVHTQFIQSTVSQLSVCTKFINPVSCLYVPSSPNPHSQASVCPEFIQSSVRRLYVPSSSIHSQPASVCTQFINPQSAICMYPVHPIHSQPSVHTQFIQSMVSHLYIPSSSMSRTPHLQIQP